MIDFGLLPPEVNSGLMYAGPGSGPMLAAAAAWQGLATELHTTASSYGTLVAGLTEGPWQGPSSASMAAAAAPQVAWLSSTAGQAEQAAAQAGEAVSAYEAAFVATVPPPEIAANRALLMMLLATNFLGQNTAAIAATEAQYAEMWAQDSAAMYSYAGAAATASTLPQFNPAASGANPAGLTAQGAAVAEAAGAAAVTDTLSQLTAALPNALSGLATPLPAAPWLSDPQAFMLALGLMGHTWNSNGDGVILTGLVGDVFEGLTGSQTLDASTGFDAFIRLISPTRLFTTATKDIQGLAQGFAPPAAKAVEGAAHAAEALPHALPGAAAFGGAAPVVGKAASIGSLSVPPSWAAGAAPVATPGVVTVNSLGAAAGAAEPASNTFGGLPLAGTGASGGRGVGHFAPPRYGFKPTVVTQPPAGG
jgi:PPE-repeat protein